MSGDGLTLLFASNRPGALSSRDLMPATRLALDVPFAGPAFVFAPPQNLVEIHGATDEADPAISADGRELFFATSRAGRSQIWHARRTCLDP